MEFKYFGRFKIAVPKTAEQGVCLVFDHTSLFDVCQWIESNYNTQKRIFRLVIPVHDNATTLARFYRIYGPNFQQKTMIDWPVGTMFEMVLMHGTPVPNTSEAWPKEDDPASINDLFTALHHYKLRCLLPHPYTGLSQIQSYVLKTLDCDPKSPFVDLKTQCFLAVGKFHIPLPIVQRHLLELYQRNLVIKTNETCIIPILVCNGPIPYDVNDVRLLLIDKAIGKTVSVAENLTPSFKGDPHPFRSVFDKGLTTKLPYGKTPEDYPTHKNDSVWGMVRLYGPQIEEKIPDAVYECFDGSQYKTFRGTDAYLDYWYDCCLDDLLSVVEARAKQETERIERKDFIRLIFCSTRITDEYGDTKRFYLDFKKKRKEQILLQKYGHTRFGDIPISAFGPDFETYGEEEETTTDPDKDVWTLEEAEQNYKSIEPELPKFITARDILKSRLMNYNEKKAVDTL